jgi:hypothetical protein
MTGKGHHLTGGDIEADAFQDIAADGLLAEADIIKIYRHWHWLGGLVSFR